ncbi:uncharacterized protein LOC129909873 [Episyrphus balteatus]|uniref:uncharacterized protein LOC129909873 n=1 Tax=Episyrphus balteatus TaxID=286459 RepID=UPI002486BA83|nr:uncharacterized protein LOC129909873 [Episyrphus balteatus]
MESNETINSSLSKVKSIPDADLDNLLVFSQKSNDNADLTNFQHHQDMEIPLHTTDLFREDDNEKEKTPNNKTQKYPAEFNLSFSLGSSDPTLVINTQKIDRIELTGDSVKNKFEESIFVHPQMKDEPLDLSIPTLHFQTLTDSKLEANVIDDLDLEFTPDPDPISARKFPPSIRPNESFTTAEDDPYLIGPSTSRPQPPPSPIMASPSRRSPMQFLTLNYSQASLEDDRPTSNTRRDLHSSENAQQDVTLVPSSVQRLYETIKISYSDFSFVYSLAAQMCQDRVPMDCFVHLKIGLLLSIASLEDNPDRPPISIVAIGPEFGMANYLMEAIGDVAERFVGPHDGFKVAPATKNSKHTWIEADPIVMAKGGIYYVGDWGRLKPTRSFKLFKTIECGRVALERTTVTCPLEAAIWTHWRSYKYDTKDENTFSKFLEIFGIPLIIEEENHEVLVDLMLEQASEKAFESTIDELSICADDMREFLSIVSKRRVDLSHEASEILRKYFVTSRMDRPDCLTQKSFVTLKLFAESFAKLSLRHDVIMIDAIAAIYMTEIVIQNIFGPGVYPPPKYQAHTYIGAVDEHMVQFQEWVKNYISQFLD